MKKDLLPLALGGLGIGTTEFVIMGLLPDIAKDFNISIPVAGHLISAYALGVVIGAPLVVVFTNRYTPKRILLVLMAVFTVFNIFSAFAPNNTTLLIARFFTGLPHGAFFGVGAVVASRLAEKGKQAQAIAVMFGGLAMANVLAVPLGTFIGHHYSWRYTFSLVALIGILTMVLIQVWLPALPVNKTGTVKSEIEFFKRTEAWLIILITAAGTGGLFAWVSYIAPLMTTVSHFSANTVPYILIVSGLGMVFGSVIGGKLADKMEPVKACMLLLFSLTGLLVLVYCFSGNQILSVSFAFLMGAFAMSLGAPISLLMIKTAKNAEMLAASATHAAFNIGNALGAFLGGLPIAAGFAYNSPALVGALLAVSGTLFAWLLIRRQQYA